MFSRLTLSLCMFAFVFLAACGGSKGSDAQSSYGSSEGGAGGTKTSAPTVDELKKTHKEAVSVTEENHELAREIFDLKNKLNVE